MRAPAYRLVPRPCRALTALVMLALVLAQALGAWHRIAHGAGGAGHHEPAASSAGVPQDPHGHAAHSDAFGHDAGSDSCRLFDLLTQADGPPCTVSVQPWVAAVFVLPLAWIAFTARSVMAFAARGPPAIH